jgi:hypothetical protein
MDAVEGMEEDFDVSVPKKRRCLTEYFATGQLMEQQNEKEARAVRALNQFGRDTRERPAGKTVSAAGVVDPRSEEADELYKKVAKYNENQTATVENQLLLRKDEFLAVTEYRVLSMLELKEDVVRKLENLPTDKGAQPILSLHKGKTARHVVICLFCAAESIGQKVEAQELLSREMRATLQLGEEAAKRLALALDQKENGVVVDHQQCSKDILQVRAARKVLTDRKVDNCFIAPSNPKSLPEHIKKKHKAQRAAEEAERAAAAGGRGLLATAATAAAGALHLRKQVD